jgi:cytochrome c oxidase subunit 2
LAVGAIPVLLTGCHVPGFATPEPASTQARDASHLWHGTQFAALAVGALVWGLIAWTVIYYRRRHGSDIPSQQATNVPLEIAYITTPIVIVAVLFTLTTITQRKMTAISAHPGLRIQATAYQWGWKFDYPSGKESASSETGPATLVLPLNTTTEIDLISTDVVHAFLVPAFLFQRNAVPGSPTRFDITPDRLGTFDGKCSTFCGIRHYAMTFSVQVLSPTDFEQWLTSP